MRLQGGTAGILAAIDAGRLDPLCAWLPEERDRFHSNGADRRRGIRREKALARRSASM